LLVNKVYTVQQPCSQASPTVSSSNQGLNIVGKLGVNYTATLQPG